MDICIRVVDKHARFRITGRVNVEVVPPACNTAANILPIILEIHREELYWTVHRANIANAFYHVLALLSRRQQVRYSVIPYRHIVEVEAKTCAIVGDHVHKFVVCNSFNVITGIADRCAKKDAILFEQGHCIHYRLIMSIAAPCIICFRRALNREQKNYVAKPNNILAQRIVNKRRICINRKFYIVVLLCQANDISFTHQRLATGEHIQVNAKFLAFSDNLIHILKGEVIPVAVCASPAACTMHIACGCRVKQDEPRNVAAVHLPIFTDHFCAANKSLITKIERCHPYNMGICFIQNPVDIAHPFVIRVADEASCHIILFICKAVAPKLLCKINRLQKCFFTILFNVRKYKINDLTHCSALNCMRHISNNCCSH